MKSLPLLDLIFLCEAPNILFILADDLGYNDVSWHNKEIYSPNLEKLGIRCRYV